MSARLHRLRFLRSRRGPKGALTFLRFVKALEYESKLAIDATKEWGVWFYNNKEEKDSTTYIEIEIEESSDPAFNASVNTAIADSTDIAIEGIVYKIAKNFTKLPLSAPRRWKLRAYLTQGRWVTP